MAAPSRGYTPVTVPVIHQRALWFTPVQWAATSVPVRASVGPSTTLHFRVPEPSIVHPRHGPNSRFVMMGVRIPLAARFAILLCVSGAASLANTLVGGDGEMADLPNFPKNVYL
jgi:hypothetical protein